MLSLPQVANRAGLGYNRTVKTTSLHNQSTSQTPSDSEPTQALPTPDRTQRIEWVPYSGPRRLRVTPGGGPRADVQGRRDLLGSIAAVALLLLLIYSLPISRPRAKPPASPPPTQQTAFVQPLTPLPPPLERSGIGASEPVRVYLVAPSVPVPSGE